MEINIFLERLRGNRVRIVYHFLNIKKNGSQILTLLKTAQNIFLLGKTKYIYKKKKAIIDCRCIIIFRLFLWRPAGMFTKLS